ncbi:hypothetical protein CVT25_003711 [Psilocybe cyanescens]|uniref:Uncharacterized protein n=1 Tax=Psilocybe cyanescens TaxID=93625 RepID=A0A409WX86_PSICY|nr:hypothetical protein CVT25_003711 [Psilocybe cyanescens]
MAHKDTSSEGNLSQSCFLRSRSGDSISIDSGIAQKSESADPQRLADLMGRKESALDAMSQNLTSRSISTTRPLLSATGFQHLDDRSEDYSPDYDSLQGNESSTTNSLPDHPYLKSARHERTDRADPDASNYYVSTNIPDPISRFGAGVSNDLSAIRTENRDQLLHNRDTVQNHIEYIFFLGITVAYRVIQLELNIGQRAPKEPLQVDHSINPANKLIQRLTGNINHLLDEDVRESSSSRVQVQDIGSGLSLSSRPFLQTRRHSSYVEPVEKDSISKTRTHDVISPKNPEDSGALHSKPSEANKQKAEPNHDGSNILKLSSSSIDVVAAPTPVLKPKSISTGHLAFATPRDKEYAYVENYMKSSILPQENAVHCVPLWNPSFGFEDGKPARCVQLGDVGYFDKNGTFVSIFNIYLSEDENRQEGFLPPKFQQYPELRRILSRTIYSGSTYSGGGFEATANPQLLQKFGSSARSVFELKGRCETASAIVVPNGGKLHYLHPLSFKSTEEWQYFNANVDEWYKYAKQFDTSLKNGRLALVTVLFMANNWGIIHCHHRLGEKLQPPLSAVLASKPGEMQDSVYMNHYQWYIAEGDATMIAKVGPLPDDMHSSGSDSIEPQCFGVGVYSIMKRSSIFSSSSTLSSAKRSVSSKGSSSKSNVFKKSFLSRG